MPILGVWSSNDKVIPPGDAGSSGFTQAKGGWLYTTGRQITRDWAKAHGCDVSEGPSHYPTASDGDKSLHCVAFNNCGPGTGPPDRFALGNYSDSNVITGKGSPVVDCRFKGGHIIPSFTPALMWEFFSNHVRELK
jgi:hypothetical protein